MKVLFAGASGAVGRLLLPMLLENGHEVVAVSRSVSETTSGDARSLKWRTLDVFDRDAVFRVMAEERPDCVMHQLTDLRERNFAANSRIRIEGTRNLVDAAKEAGMQRMIAQSIVWIYEPGASPADESTPLDLNAPSPRGDMMRGVVGLESAVKEIPNHVILRYGFFYGPGTWYEPGGNFAEQLRNGQVEATTAITSFVHVEDAARAALLALHWPNGPVNVVDGDPAPETEWMPRFADWADAPVPRFASAPPAFPLRPVSNAYALSLGWAPRHPSWKGEFSKPV